MVPKANGFNQSERLPAHARAHLEVFHARLPRQGIGEVMQMQHVRHHGDTIWHPKSGYVTTIPGTSTFGRNNNAIFSD